MRIGVGTPQDYECVVPGGAGGIVGESFREGHVGLWGSCFGKDRWDCGGVYSGGNDQYCQILIFK